MRLGGEALRVQSALARRLRPGTPGSPRSHIKPIHELHAQALVTKSHLVSSARGEQIKSESFYVLPSTSESKPTGQTSRSAVPLTQAVLPALSAERQSLRSSDIAMGLI